MAYGVMNVTTLNKKTSTLTSPHGLKFQDALNSKMTINDCFVVIVDKKWIP